MSVLLKKLFLIFLILLATLIFQQIKAAEGQEGSFNGDTSNEAIRDQPIVEDWIFLYKGKEYPWKSFLDPDETTPVELQSTAQPGDAIGYRIQVGEKVIENVSGSVSKDHILALSNGIHIPIDEMTISRIFSKIYYIHRQLHIPDFAYIR
ncbi:MAG: hypothetical protein V1789_07630 [PVC group bacterium]